LTNGRESGSIRSKQTVLQKGLTHVSKTVLVADDDSAIVQLIKFNLELEGFDVVVAYDGLAALDLAKTVKPDLLILDIMMPKLDGWDVVSEVRRDKQCKIST